MLIRKSILNCLILGSAHEIDKEADKIKSPITSGNIHQASVPLAAAISSYARISIFEFKIIPGNSWYYSDTDSIVLSNELDDDVVSATELGKMKLEYKVLKAVFIAPKVYALLLENGDTVIKAAGFPAQALKFSTFEDLLHGKDTVVVGYAQ